MKLGAWLAMGLGAWLSVWLGVELGVGLGVGLSAWLSVVLGVELGVGLGAWLSVGLKHLVILKESITLLTSDVCKRIALSLNFPGSNSRNTFHYSTKILSGLTCSV